MAIKAFFVVDNDDVSSDPPKNGGSRTDDGENEQKGKNYKKYFQLTTPLTYILFISTILFLMILLF